MANIGNVLSAEDAYPLPPGTFKLIRGTVAHIAHWPTERR